MTGPPPRSCLLSRPRRRSSPRFDLVVGAEVCLDDGSGCRRSRRPPSAISRPWAITSTQSLISWTMSMSCSTNRTVRPSSLSSLMCCEQALLQRRVDPGHRLVEHDQLRVAHQRPGHLEQLALPAGQVAGVFVAHLVEPEPVRAVRGPLGDGALLLGANRLTPSRIAHRAARRRAACSRARSARGLGQLERAHHAVFGPLGLMPPCPRPSNVHGPYSPGRTR